MNVRTTGPGDLRSLRGLAHSPPQPCSTRRCGADKAPAAWPGAIPAGAQAGNTAAALTLGRRYEWRVQWGPRGGGGASVWQLGLTTTAPLVAPPGEGPGELPPGDKSWA